MRWVVVVLLAMLCLLVCGCVEEPKVVTKENTKDVNLTNNKSDKKNEVEENVKGSYSNPASMNDIVAVDTLSGQFEVQVLDCMRGIKANRVIKEANMFNLKLDRGFEYLLVKVKFTYTSGKNPHYLSAYSFKVYADGVGYSPSFVILPEELPEFKDVDLMAGGSAEGWIAFMVPENTETLIAYEYLFKPVCFIKVC